MDVGARPPTLLFSYTISPLTPMSLSVAPGARVRAWFGLSQPELARYLGLSAAALAHAEAGRRPLPARALARLRPVAAVVPAADEYPAPPRALAVPLLPPLPSPLLPPLPADLPEPLRRRHRDLHQLARSLAVRLARQQAQAAALAARRRGLARLASLLPPIPVEAVAWRAWVAGLLTALALAAPDPAAAAVEARLLAARLAGVRAELAALAATPWNPFGA